MPSTQEAANPQRITAVGLLFCVKKENRVTHLELLGSLFTQHYNSLSRRFSLPRILCSATVGVDYVGDDIVGLFEHPVVSPRDA